MSTLQYYASSFNGAVPWDWGGASNKCISRKKSEQGLAIIVITWDAPVEKIIPPSSPFFYVLYHKEVIIDCGVGGRGEMGGIPPAVSCIPFWTKIKYLKYLIGYHASICNGW